jgi:hypothetical protein
LSEQAIPLARALDEHGLPETANELHAITAECLQLARETGDVNMIAAAQHAFDHVGSRSIAPELNRLLERPVRGS